MRVDFVDGWVELREIQFGDVRFVNKQTEDQLDQTALLLARVITGWSYDRAIDEAGIDALPMSVFSRLSEELQKQSAGTKDDTRPLGNGSTSSPSASTNTVKEPATPALTS